MCKIKMLMGSLNKDCRVSAKVYQILSCMTEHGPCLQQASIQDTLPNRDAITVGCKHTASRQHSNLSGGQGYLLLPDGDASHGLQAMLMREACCSSSQPWRSSCSVSQTKALHFYSQRCSGCWSCSLVTRSLASLSQVGWTVRAVAKHYGPCVHVQYVVVQPVCTCCIVG